MEDGHMRMKRRQFLQAAAVSGGAMLLTRPDRAGAEQQFLTSAPLGSFKLFYEVHGDGPAVVFAHGSGGHAHELVAAGSCLVETVPVRDHRPSRLRLLERSTEQTGTTEFRLGSRRTAGSVEG